MCILQVITFFERKPGTCSLKNPANEDKSGFTGMGIA